MGVTPNVASVSRRQLVGVRSGMSLLASTRKMFTRLGLFDDILCPERSSCHRNSCLFSHRTGARYSSAPCLPSLTATVPSSSSSSSSTTTTSTSGSTSSTVSTASSILKKTVPAKRLLPVPQAIPATLRDSQPPRKLQKLDTVRSQRPSSPNTSTSTSTTATIATSTPQLVPVLNATAATSKIPIPVRQSCLKTLYDTFVTLYSSFHDKRPTLARDHALAQEQDVYSKTNKLTYRQAIISSIVSLKKRPQPNTPVHDSVGTETDLQLRAKARKITRVSAQDLENRGALLSEEQMTAWGFMLEVPSGVGGDKPSSEGEERVCERCSERFIVTPLGQGKDEACSFHWARPYTKTINGEKIKTYKCCAMTHPGPGCSLGPHVFYEKSPDDLHRRHAFTLTSEPAPPPTLSNDAFLDVAALDCEMIYTTGGMSVARVSVVDSEGKQVFDEIVRPDRGVQVIDYITRFSGITPEMLNNAVLDLSAVRQALRAIIGPNTILVGHALENDLKTLRMVHRRVVDTCMLFPHKGGPPFRRALRDIVSDKLQKMIQVGGEAGHSSIEDAVATLDLVRWWMANEKPFPSKGKEKAS